MRIPRRRLVRGHPWSPLRRGRQASARHLSGSRYPRSALVTMPAFASRDSVVPTVPGFTPVVAAIAPGVISPPPSASMIDARADPDFRCVRPRERGASPRRAAAVPVGSAERPMPSLPSVPSLPPSRASRSARVRVHAGGVSASCAAARRAARRRARRAPRGGFPPPPAAPRAAARCRFGSARSSRSHLLRARRGDPMCERPSGRA